MHKEVTHHPIVLTESERQLQQKFRDIDLKLYTLAAELQGISEERQKKHIAQNEYDINHINNPKAYPNPPHNMLARIVTMLTMQLQEFKLYLPLEDQNRQGAGDSPEVLERLLEIGGPLLRKRLLDPTKRCCNCGSLLSTSPKGRGRVFEQ